MNPRRVYLLVILVICSGALFPRSAYAQPAFGAWNGVESLTIQEYQNNVLVNVVSDVNVPATLSVSFNSYPPMGVATANLTIIGDLVYQSISGPADFYSYDPMDASGNVIQNGHFGPSIGDFYLSFQSVLPDGTIDTSSGSALVDMTLIQLDTSVSGEIIRATFQSVSVPEPSTLVQAGTGMAALLLFAAMTRRRASVRQA